jgi:glycerophosphoryl diester phosphodiesterase
LNEFREYAIGVAPEWGSVDKELVNTAHDVGMVVHPYTVNNVDDMKRLIDYGVDGMFTDFPDRLRALL